MGAGLAWAVAASVSPATLAGIVPISGIREVSCSTSKGGGSLCSAAPLTKGERERRLAWLAVGGVGDEGLDRLDLARLALDLEALSLRREPPTEEVYKALEGLERDAAVALLRMASTPSAGANYTEKIRDLGKKHFSISFDSPRQRRRRMRRRGGSSAQRSMPPWVERLSSVGSGGVDEKGIVVVRPRNGVGNRLLAVISAAGLALALNWSFAVLWEDPMFGGILSSAGVNARSLRAVAAAGGVQPLSLVSGWPNFDSSAKEVACSSSGTPVGKVRPGVLLVHSDQFFLPLLQLEASRGGAVSRRQSLLFAMGVHDAPTSPGSAQEAADEVGRWSQELLSGLFRFSPRVAAVVRRESKRLLGDVSFVLGVHVRTQMYDYETPLVPDITMEDIFTCIEAALSAEAPNSSVAGNAVIFLATPSGQVKKAARRRFGARLRTRRNVVTDRSKSAAEEDAMVDLALLAMSDALVTSVQSTFGYVAQSLASLRPYVVSEGTMAEGAHGTASSGHRQCRQASSSVPCFHAGIGLLARALAGGGGVPWRCGGGADMIARSGAQVQGAAIGFSPWAKCRF